MLQGGVPLDWSFDPLEALRRWPHERKVVLLHSGRFHPRWARWSILAEPAGTYRFDPEGRSAWIGAPPAGWSASFRHKPFADLRQVVLGADELWIGYLSYDLGRWIENLPSRARDDRAWPLIDLARCPGYLVYDGRDGRWQAFGNWRDGTRPPLDRCEPRTAALRASTPRSLVSRSAHEASVATALEYIAAGDVFQVNLAHRFTAQFDASDPDARRTLFCKLAGISPAWYGAYLETADDPAASSTGRVIASTSPELFLHLDHSGRVTSRPIKGTRPASVDPAELCRSEKDTAELNMIVDLVRNDLGRVCDYGSVTVDQPRMIESHPTVHHGVATIGGRLHRSRDVVDLLRATMPGGSVTGAPKIRAMQIIDELEPVRRGPYCGCIGFLSRRAACMNIAIRTMQIEPDHRRLDYSVGGGIVADSDPGAEYDETIDKAAAMVSALRSQTPAPATVQPVAH
jgi:para-aminobenzoate synthetase component 1